MAGISSDNIASPFLLCSNFLELFLRDDGRHYIEGLIERFLTGVSPALAFWTASYDYEYDGLGNITKITKTVGGTTTDLYRYKYDEASQLVREDNCVTNQTTKWQYDIGGNIRSRTVYALAAENSEPSDAIDTIDYGYSTGIWKDLLTSYDGQSISYDASGNPTSYLGVTLTWTMGRQLASYDKGSLSIDYTYNENGIRTSKTVNNVRTDYYLNGSQVISEVTNGNRIDYRYDGNGQLIALRYNSNEYYYVTNIQGDIIGLIDGSGASVVQYTYDAWGNQTSCTGTLANTLGEANPYRYRGYRFDTETGLYYLQSRYYDAAVGRFINADDLIYGIGEVDYNVFIYCMNCCVMYIDNNGIRPQIDMLEKNIGYERRVYYINPPTKLMLALDYVMDYIGSNYWVRNRMYHSTAISGKNRIYVFVEMVRSYWLTNLYVRTQFYVAEKTKESWLKWMDSRYYNGEFIDMVSDFLGNSDNDYLSYLSAIIQISNKVGVFISKYSLNREQRFLLNLLSDRKYRNLPASELIPIVYTIYGSCAQITNRRNIIYFYEWVTMCSYWLLSGL